MALLDFIPIAGDIVEGVFAGKNARDQRKWQQHMSDTAHQREVKDLRAAGLNPILSATGGSGASTPSGATAATPNYSGSLQSAIMNKLQRQLLQSQIEETSAKAVQATASTEQARSAAINLDEDTKTKAIINDNLPMQQRGQLEQLRATIQKLDTDRLSSAEAVTRQRRENRLLLKDALAIAAISPTAFEWDRLDKLLENPDKGDILKFLLSLSKR